MKQKLENNKKTFKDLTSDSIKDIPKVHKDRDCYNVETLPNNEKTTSNTQQLSKTTPVYIENNLKNDKNDNIYVCYEPPIGSLLAKFLKVLENPTKNFHIKKEIVDEINQMPDYLTENQYEEIVYVNEKKKSPVYQTYSHELSTADYKHSLLAIVNNISHDPLDLIAKQLVVSQFEEIYDKITAINNQPIVSQPISNRNSVNTSKFEKKITEPSVMQTSGPKKLKDIKAFKHQQKKARNKEISWCLPCLPGLSR